MEKTEAERALEFKTQGNEHFKKEEFVKAIECYTKAIELNPMEPSYFGNRAACYLGLKKYQKCIQDCDETLNLDPKFTKAWLRKGRSCFRLGRPEEAKSCLEKAIEIDPKDKAIKDELNTIAQIERMMKAANAELENQRFSNALLEVTQVLKLCPDLIEGKVKQIEILVKSGQIDKAISISNECFHECSGNTDYLYVRGLALCYNGQTEVAKKTWMEAMRLDPDNTSCRMAIKRMNRQEEAKERGNAAFKAGKYEEAVAAYTEGIEQDPLNKNVVSTLWANRGAANWKLKKLQEAIQDCDKAIELNDGYAKAYLRRGDIKMEAEQYEEAGRDFNKAHQLDPSLGARQRIKDAEIEAKKAARKDYYKILGVEKTANEGDIKKAYRKLALKWHPDKNSGSEEEKKTAEAKFKDINEAYSILSDPQKRQRFDSGADLDGMDFGGHGHGGFGDMDPNIIFRTFFGGGGGGDDPFGGAGGFPGGFSFGGGGGRGGRGGGPGFTFKMG